jgi:hypothetical protein
VLEAGNLQGGREMTCGTKTIRALLTDTTFDASGPAKLDIIARMPPGMRHCLL